MLAGAGSLAYVAWPTVVYLHQIFNGGVCLSMDLYLQRNSLYISFGNKLYRPIVGISMGTKCAPLVVDLFLFCFERDFLTPLSDDNQTDIIEAFNSTSRYLDDLLRPGLQLNEDIILQIPKSVFGLTFIYF